MSARQDLISAAQTLIQGGTETFTMSQLLAESRHQGSTYPDVTLRTMISYHLRVDLGRVKAGLGFEQVSRGLYRLATVEGANCGQSIERSLDPPSPPGGVELAIANVEHDWFWEGNVQAVIVRHLAADRWDIRRVADTASREHGIDIEADRDGRRLLIEVKGYPSATYRSGPSEGQRKTFGVGAQARTYFGNAVLAGLLMRADNPDARVVLAFPAMETFRALVQRTAGPLSAAAVEQWLVTEYGEVISAQTLPPPAVARRSE